MSKERSASGSRTCSNPPAWGAALRAEGGGRAATAAAPGPGAAARLTARAWPGAGVLLTWAQRETPAGPCRVQLQPQRREQVNNSSVLAHGPTAQSRLYGT